MPDRQRSAPVRLRSACLLLAITTLPLLLASSVAQALTLGQIDDFETETAEGWAVGIGDVPVQVSGGPDGVGDAYLEPTASGGAGAGSRLIVFNALQWAGDYPGEGVGVVALDALHVSGSDVFLRITLSGPSGSVVSTLPIVLSPPAVWELLEFSLAPEDLTFLGGTGDIDSVLADTTQIRFLHSVDLPGLGVGGLPSGDTVVATIGIDNVEALPEPGVGAQVVAGLVVLAQLRRRRARTR